MHLKRAVTWNVHSSSGMALISRKVVPQFAYFCASSMAQYKARINTAIDQRCATVKSQYRLQALASQTRSQCAGKNHLITGLSQAGRLQRRPPGPSPVYRGGPPGPRCVLPLFALLRVQLKIQLIKKEPRRFLKKEARGPRARLSLLMGIPGRAGLGTIFSRILPRTFNKTRCRAPAPSPVFKGAPPGSGPPWPVPRGFLSKKPETNSRLGKERQDFLV